MEHARFWRAIHALMAKTVENGCAPPEAAAARAKLAELVQKYGNFPETGIAPRLSIKDRASFAIFTNPWSMRVWMLLASSSLTTWFLLFLGVMLAIGLGSAVATVNEPLGTVIVAAPIFIWLAALGWTLISGAVFWLCEILWLIGLRTKRPS